MPGPATVGHSCYSVIARVLVFAIYSCVIPIPPIVHLHDFARLTLNAVTQFFLETAYSLAFSGSCQPSLTAPSHWYYKCSASIRPLFASIYISMRKNTFSSTWTFSNQCIYHLSWLTGALRELLNDTLMRLLHYLTARSRRKFKTTLPHQP